MYRQLEKKRYRQKALFFSSIISDGWYSGCRSKHFPYLFQKYYGDLFAVMLESELQKPLFLEDSAISFLAAWLFHLAPLSEASEIFASAPKLFPNRNLLDCFLTQIFTCNYADNSRHSELADPEIISGTSEEQKQRFLILADICSCQEIEMACRFLTASIVQASSEINELYHFRLPSECSRNLYHLFI